MRKTAYCMSCNLVRSSSCPVTVQSQPKVAVRISAGYPAAMRRRHEALRWDCSCLFERQFRLAGLSRYLAASAARRADWSTRGLIWNATTDGRGWKHGTLTTNLKQGTYLALLPVSWYYIPGCTAGKFVLHTWRYCR